jgi:hypothetical protein
VITVSHCPVRQDVAGKEVHDGEGSYCRREKILREDAWIAELPVATQRRTKNELEKSLFVVAG